MTRGRKSGGVGHKVSQSPVPTARARGVEAVRRPLDPSSYDLLKTIGSVIEPEVQSLVRLFVPKALTVTTVGFHRISTRHMLEGPRTSAIAEQISLSHEPVAAILGKFALLGSGNKIKLGLWLGAPKIIEEEGMYIDSFAQKGFPLEPEYHSKSGRTTPHISLGLATSDRVDYLSEEILAKLDSLSACQGKEITLQPPKFMQ